MGLMFGLLERTSALLGDIFLDAGQNNIEPRM